MTNPLQGYGLGMLMVAFALASEPGPGGIEVHPSLPPLEAEVVLGWDEVGLADAREDAPAFGPEHLAIGPGGRWALWDPVRLRVIGDAGELLVDHADSLAFGADGDLWVLDETRRQLSRWSGVDKVGAWSMDRLCPTGVDLVIDGDEPRGIDIFGNSRRLVAGETLRAPEHVAKRTGATLTVDGRVLAAPADVLGAKLLGDWVVIEAGRPGAVRLRQAVSLTSGKVVTLPGRAGQVYRAADDVAVAPDGAIGWIDPQADGLHLRRVSP